jgi:hypothetical protein
MRTSKKIPRPSLLPSVLAIQRYADSFVGLTMEEAKRRLPRAKRRMTKWDGGKQLVATFPKYEVRVLFFEDEVLTASIQILSQ